MLGLLSAVVDMSFLGVYAVLLYIFLERTSVFDAQHSQEKKTSHGRRMVGLLVGHGQKNMGKIRKKNVRKKSQTN